jgi:hypothetical protein
MANNTDSNFARKLANGFLTACESNRVLTKAVDTQKLSGKFNPSSGANVDFKRPHDYNTIDTSDGDISSSTKSDIISGKATGTVQNYITVATEWSNIEEALELNELERVLNPMATRMITALELKLGRYMSYNGNLSIGTPGTAVDAWTDVAAASTLMAGMGVPMDSDWCYAMTPYTSQSLANLQTNLSSGSPSLVDSAWQRAQIATPFAGMKALSSNALPTRNVTTAADLVGAVDGAPTATYVGAKDTMTQDITVDAFTASAVIKAGDIVEITGVSRRSLGSREPLTDATGTAVPWRATVTADVTLSGAGAGTINVAGPAIFEANGQYDTSDIAIPDNAVITILGTSGALVQPNLFFHKQAFGLGTVKLPKLYATDTIATTSDGFSIRVCRYADGDANTQKVRFDLLPAFATFNPFFAGQAFGIA